VVATTVNLLVYNLPQCASTSSSKKSKKKGKQKEKPISDLELQRTIELPVLPGGIEGSTFRAARFVWFLSSITVA
jgi:prolactin regulatory element-binding protein